MLKVIEVAEVCHETNRAYCEILGDLTQVPFAVAPDWQRDSAVLGVLNRVRNPGSPASQSHESWLAQKVAEGWVYGPVKDPVTKTHPCVRPFDELPIEQQTKDVLFCAVVDALSPLIAAHDVEAVAAEPMAVEPEPEPAPGHGEEPPVMHGAGL